MKCYFHPDRDAVATCQNCGKSLCKECAEKYQPCLCDDCYKILRQQEIENLKAARKQLRKTIIISLILGGFFALITLTEGKENFPWIFAFVAFFAPYGWNYANLLGLTWFFNINPSGCLLMAFVYTFRALVASVIGVFCFFAAIFRFMKLKKAEKTIEIEMNN